MDYFLGHDASSSTAAKNAIHHPHEVKLISETKENTILDTCEVSEDVSLRIGSTPKAVVLPPKWPNAVGRGGVLLSEDTSLTVLPIPFVEQGVAEPIPETEPVVSLSPDNSQDDPTDGINPANITSTLIPTSAMIYPCPSQPTLDEPIDTSALQTMKLILSSDYLHSSALNSIPTPRIIRSLYTSMKSRSQLNQLTPLEFSSLINLFGGLSHLSYSQSNSEMYGFGQMRDLIRKIAKREGEAKKGSRTYWPFVTLLVSDKQRVMMGRLEVVDRYWAMRAELALLEGGEGAQGQ